LAVKPLHALIPCFVTIAQQVQFPNHYPHNPEKNLNRQVAKGAKEDLSRNPKWQGDSLEF
jgi:hypothetical protein